MTLKYYAHSLKNTSGKGWQPLEEHLKNVAEKARMFADDFDAGDWAYRAGIWHDLGKYSDDFQQMLSASEGNDEHIETQPKRVDHSTAGAQHAYHFLGDAGKLLAYAIAGHHAGIPNGKSNESSCLIDRFQKVIPDYYSAPDWILKSQHLNDPPITPQKKRFGFQLSFFIRMIFSCLVDSDFLDTEEFIDSEKSAWRKGYPSLLELNRKMTSALNQLTANALPTSINKHRAAILNKCLDVAEYPQGLFSLTVPTGGGKTLSSLAFAMKHALKNGLRKIIYVIPYTSIIEQNAAVFRNILGENAVLEHHSNYEPKEEDHLSRLAAENWDAPLVVTTNVQFFESLFSSRPSRCRKIHNIANSVVILDEAQMLPVPLLKPCIEALRELADVYKTTIVLCTATQPALSTTETFKNGLDGVHEIIPNPPELYSAFKRVRTEHLSTLSDEDLSSKLVVYDRVLCILNTRKHARSIYELISKEKDGCYHLSALMCPEHRTETLNRIRTALLSGHSCRVVSTQLIEAGVDIDFPVVFRCAAGIDSIAQAAGRCNREGNLSGKGKVYIFSPEDPLPPGQFRHTTEVGETVMRHHDDPLSLDAVNEYFQTLYWRKGEKLDEYQILDDLAGGTKSGDFPFRVVDDKFKIIRDGTESIIVPWNEEAERIIQGLRYTQNPAKLARKAQRYTVQVYPRMLSSLDNSGSIERIHDQYCVLSDMNLYRDDLGLCPDAYDFLDPASLMA